MRQPDTHYPKLIHSDIVLSPQSGVRVSLRYLGEAARHYPTLIHSPEPGLRVRGVSESRARFKSGLLRLATERELESAHGPIL